MFKVQFQVLAATRTTTLTSITKYDDTHKYHRHEKYHYQNQQRVPRSPHTRARSALAVRIQGETYTGSFANVRFFHALAGWTPGSNLMDRTELNHRTTPFCLF